MCLCAKTWYYFDLIWWLRDSACVLATWANVSPKGKRWGNLPLTELVWTWPRESERIRERQYTVYLRDGKQIHASQRTWRYMTVYNTSVSVSVCVAGTCLKLGGRKCPCGLTMCQRPIKSIIKVRTINNPLTQKAELRKWRGIEWEELMKGENVMANMWDYQECRVRSECEKMCL